MSPGNGSHTVIITYMNNEVLSLPLMIARSCICDKKSPDRTPISGLFFLYCTVYFKAYRLQNENYIE